LTAGVSTELRVDTGMNKSVGTSRAVDWEK
jgi:hypothetical protein